MYTARSLVGWIHDVGMLHVTMHYVSMYYVKEKANTSFQQDKNRKPKVFMLFKLKSKIDLI